MAMDLANLKKEAEDAGLVMGTDAAERADRLGDAFDKLMAVTKSVRMVIADSVADTISDAVGAIT